MTTFKEAFVQSENFSVTDTATLRKACIKHGWFTEGTNWQYEKLFYANTHGCPIEEIATIIWLCSDEEMGRREILQILEELREEQFADLKRHKW